MDLLAALVALDRGLDLDLAEVVAADHGVALVGAEQQRLERHLGALVLAQPVDDELVARLDAVLLAADSTIA